MVMQLTVIVQVGGFIPGRPITGRATGLQALLTLVQTLLSRKNQKMGGLFYWAK